ncbi:hypothetical protein Nepgr_030200 [Nepenthes gracilis]|uniref:H(+)-exporting diphosphatase n=1 Tax=Nepenthes gracilis TaxID=150966 RepID=A0AAD3TFB8_NEPGR|nr:hypothetical protein Nepgr_030200 [Nepenthes gracilis]
MEAFPSKLELTVASSLLLLSDRLLSRSTEKTPLNFTAADGTVNVEKKSKKAEDDGEGLLSSDSTYCPSSMTCEGPSIDAIQVQRLKVMAAAAARCQEIKLMVVRRTRSKIHYLSNRRRETLKVWKASPLMMTARSTASEFTAEASSCLSSGSSDISSGRSPYAGKSGALVQGELRRRGVSSGHIRRRAEAILKLLSGGCSSEVRIRQVLGDSPDTSKALRMLLKTEEVKRTGAGGRSDPYIYQFTAVRGFPLAANGCLVFYIVIHLLALYHDVNQRGPLKLTTAYGFGGSSMTSIDRVGGGIYPQTAAIGTANVGKFIKPILKDHLRHSVVFADNVGANVGCIASTCRSYAIPPGAALIVIAIRHDPYHTLGLVYNALGNKKTVENKFTNDASRDQPVVVVVSSTTTSNLLKVVHQPQGGRT